MPTVARGQRHRAASVTTTMEYQRSNPTVLDSVRQFRPGLHSHLRVHRGDHNGDVFLGHTTEGLPPTILTGAHCHKTFHFLTLWRFKSILKLRDKIVERSRYDHFLNIFFTLNL